MKPKKLLLVTLIRAEKFLLLARKFLIVAFTSSVALMTLLILTIMLIIAVQEFRLPTPYRTATPTKQIKPGFAFFAQDSVIECKRGDLYIYRPKSSELTLVKFKKLIYNEVMPASVVDGIIYASWETGDAGFSPSIIFNANTNKLKVNYIASGKEFDLPETQCKVRKLR